ncbi:MAG: hypothetical protein RPU90_04415 [Candidatus Sedimenticola sp. (ex Thyasira tokunagai)]
MPTQNLTMYSDREIVNFVDRDNPQIDELCKRLETAADNAEDVETMEEERDDANREISMMETRNNLLRERIQSMRNVLQRFVDRGNRERPINTTDIDLAEEVLAECEA